MQFQTLNTLYTLYDVGDGAFLISGHPKYCPTPTRVEIDNLPIVGHRVLFRDRDKSSPRYGRSTITTPVVEVWL